MLIPSHAEEGKGEEETEGFDIARVFEVCELDKARGSCSVIPCPSPTPPILAAATAVTRGYVTVTCAAVSINLQIMQLTNTPHKSIRT